VNNWEVRGSRSSRGSLREKKEARWARGRLGGRRLGIERSARGVERRLTESVVTRIASSKPLSFRNRSENTTGGSVGSGVTKVNKIISADLGARGASGAKTRRGPPFAMAEWQRQRPPVLGARATTQQGEGESTKNFYDKRADDNKLLPMKYG